MISHGVVVSDHLERDNAILSWCRARHESVRPTIADAENEFPSGSNLHVGSWRTIWIARRIFVATA
jgi:hypothetical protein